MAQTYGFIGLGTMGMPTVTRLASAGFPLVVYDVNAQALAAAASLAGVAAAASPREVAERSDCIFSFLPQIESILEVFVGSGGVIESARAGLVTCDHSSVLPSTAVDLVAKLGAAGITHLDAPVFGGASNCTDGTLTVIVSGDESAYTQVLPVIEAISKAHHYVGDAGKASAVKLMQNALGLVQTSAMAETFALCEEVGVDPKLFYDIVQGGGGMADSWVFQSRGKKMVNRDYAMTAFVDVPAKDSSLAVMMADEAGLDVPVLRESMRYFKDAKDAGWGRRDVSIIAKVVDLRRGRIKPEDV
jgi:2-hydroxy-3-oxopropionate reductase